VAEVSFSQWTNDGVIRHPVFRGLREEKEPSRIVREVAVSLAPAKPPRTSAIKVTHGDRLIDASTGLTKLDLVEYYRASAPYMLDHIKERPVALVRAPSGINGQVFFQKQPDTLKFPGLNRLGEELNPGHGSMMSFSTEGAIVQAAQLNVVEFHPWNAKARAIERPDRVIFDLDPGEKVPFERVAEAALLTRTMLEELGLTSFIKTSGGKGLHVVVPISPRLGWDPVKRFADAVVNHLERVFPSRFVTKSGAHNRIGRIYIDVGRNLRGATTVAAYSARARPGLGVSVPISWDELPAIKSGDQWTIVTAPERLGTSAQAWHNFKETKQSLAEAMRQLA
jgi:bifunctional non-homologous end joining protein LigD